MLLDFIESLVRGDFICKLSYTKKWKDFFSIFACGAFQAIHTNRQTSGSCCSRSRTGSAQRIRNQIFGHPACKKFWTEENHYSVWRLSGAICRFIWNLSLFLLSGKTQLNFGALNTQSSDTHFVCRFVNTLFGKCKSDGARTPCGRCALWVSLQLCNGGATLLWWTKWTPPQLMCHHWSATPPPSPQHHGQRITWPLWLGCVFICAGKH